jgi:hypothetical protein
MPAGSVDQKGKHMPWAGTTVIRWALAACLALPSAAWAGAALGQAAAGAAQPADVEAVSCAVLTARHPGAPCSFDFSGFPEPDQRLAAIERGGVSGSGLFPGAIYLARTPAELEALSTRVRAGDQVVLTDGTWRDADIRFSAQGETSRPIILRPQTPGGVVFAGSSSLRLWGTNLIAYGLEFRDGQVDRDNFVVLQLGGGAERPCDGCIVDRVVIDNYNPAPARYDDLNSFYLILQGHNITVANSRFLHKNNVGTVVHAEQPQASGCARAGARGGACSQRLTFTGNVLSDVSVGVRRHSGVAKIKLMEIGSGHTAARPAYTLIENNLFQHADGGTNTVVIKTSDVIVRDNRFVDNLGVLNLRSSNRTLVDGNLFDGSNRPGMGGVLVQGGSHWIVGNRFKNLSAPLNLYHYPVSMSAGAYEDLADEQKDYARAKRIVVADNVFENVVHPPIAMGVYPLPQRGRTMSPADIFVVGNDYSLSAGRAAPDLQPANDLVGFVGQPPPSTEIHLNDNQRTR